MTICPVRLDRGSTWGVNPKTGDEIERKPDETQPFTSLAFKIATDPFVGKLAYFRVYAGKLNAGSYVLNSSTGEKERVGTYCSICRLMSAKMSISVGAGDIAAIVGLKRYDHRQYFVDIRQSD